MRIALISQEPSPTTLALASASARGTELVPMTPLEALARLGPGDVAVGRLDVLPTLDGIDDGLWVLGALAATGVTVLNGPGALLAAHDKLLTARILARGGLPHPVTRLVRGDQAEIELEPPLVVKPRHGSWGRDVTRCVDSAALDAELARIADTPWYLAHGALVQELVSPLGYDLRIVVAGGDVVGAVRRVAAAGEWRTNVALGAMRVRVVAPEAAARIATAAATATAASLVGVDLLPDGSGGWTILELNGAVEFNETYGPDVFEKVAMALAREALDHPTRARTTPPAPAFI